MLPRLPKINPLAAPENVIEGANHRITVLDDGLLRLEYSTSGQFEDRASQAAVDRSFPPARFSVTESDDLIEIHTARLHLVYDKKPFSTEGLSVQAKDGSLSHGRVWRYGQTTPNLGGTARTLDEIDGSCPLEPGVLSRQGVAVVDDSRTVLLDDGWIAARHPGSTDLYVFAYGTDYKSALKAFYRLTGSQPLLPRFALGNWWSRYHPYSAEEYLGLMDRFAAEDVPLSVAVIDMDWHHVDIDPRYGTGWTGYSWNTDLFPDPSGFLAALRERGLATSLNVHPAEGVHAHEDRYPEMAARVGIAPDSKLPVNFDPTDPDFLEAYFEELHHPLEADGVGFWWLDWQQGGVTKVPGLDPLWLLNHFHFLDSGRDGDRPMTFSRYAGIGSHRYPVGFSGDTVISWASLDFQPYFTATASNVGYGWWSHDIGGHFFGRKDDELVIRWVQLGVFSPIMRLHSSLSAFNSKEPWRFGEQAERVMKQSLRLRHQLVPYLYSMNRRANEEDEPLVQPMYYDHPRTEEAYARVNEYMFGSELLIAPITTPSDRETQLGAVTAWLPPGEWIDIATGLSYRGGRTLVLHRGLDSIPALARAGSILPLVPLDDVGFGTANPSRLELRVYAGGDASFTLSEDRDDERWAETTFSLAAATVRILPTTGDLDSVPAQRSYDLVLCGFASIERVTRDGQDLPLEPGPVPGSVRVAVATVAADTGVTLSLTGDLRLGPNRDVRQRVFALLDAAHMEFAHKEAAWAVLNRPDAALDRVVAELTALDLPSALYSALIELLTANPAV